MQLEFGFTPTPKTKDIEKPMPPPAHSAQGASTLTARSALEQAAENLRRELNRQTECTIGLTITDNTSRIISSKRYPSHNLLHVRLHHMFLDAPPDVVTALAYWLEHPRSNKAGAVVDQFISANQHRIAPRKRRTIYLYQKGDFFDLAELFNELNHQMFQGTVTAKITWGMFPSSSGRRRSIRFGSYVEEQDLIRVHPALDQDFVPRYFVRYIVFHEMLHAYVGVSRSPSGRRRVHPPEFKLLEQAYPDYERAVAWQNDPTNINRLLRFRPHGE